MDKLIATPQEVRGYGNILEKRERTSFIRFHCDLLDSESDVTLNELSFNYFHMQLRGLEITITVSTLSVATVNSSYTISLDVTVEEDDEPVPNVDVTLTDTESNQLLDTGTTDNTGATTLSFTPDRVGTYDLVLGILSQNQYAEQNKQINVTVACTCNIPQILTSVTYDESNDRYVLTYTSGITSRSQLSDGFVSDVYIDNQGNLCVKYNELANHNETNLLFDDDLDALEGAIHEVYQDSADDSFKKTKFTKDYTNFSNGG